MFIIIGVRFLLEAKPTLSDWSDRYFLGVLLVRSFVNKIIKNIF